MAADDFDLERLDFPALQAFIDEGVKKFHQELQDIRKTDPKSPSLYEISTRSPVLKLGWLEEDDDTGTKALAGRAKTAAAAVDGVFNKHVTAFGDLQNKLEDVITTMKKAQQQNLADVDAQKFLTAFSGYETALGGGNSNASVTPPNSSN